MNTIKPRGGLGNAFFGALFGVVTVIALHGIIAAVNGEDVQLIPTILFDGNIREFMGDYLSYFFTTMPGLIYLGITILCYIAATYYVQESKPEPTRPGVPASPDIIEHDTSGTMRGWLIGLASAMNFILAYNIYRHWDWIGETVGLVIAIGLFALGILGSIRAISQNVAYQGVIGWLCWLAPMSWLVTVLGLSLFVLNLIGWIIGLFGANFFKLGGDKTDANAASLVKKNRWTADWATGTIFLIGGWIGNLNPAKTAFDMGNFSFFHRKAKGDFRKHEAGHNLSLFAYGWIVHLVGAIDQNIGYGEESIVERMAESHGSSGTTGATRPTLEVWD